MRLINKKPWLLQEARDRSHGIQKYSGAQSIKGHIIFRISLNLRRA